jgi:hypothetical protein
MVGERVQQETPGPQKDRIVAAEFQNVQKAQAARLCGEVWRHPDAALGHSPGSRPGKSNHIYCTIHQGMNLTIVVQ